MVKNPPSNAGDRGSIPGQGTNISHAAGQLSPGALETERHKGKIPCAATKTRHSQIKK